VNDETPRPLEGATAIVMIFAGLVAPLSLYFRGEEPGPLLFANLVVFVLSTVFLASRSSWWALGWIGFPAIVLLVGDLDLGAVFVLLPVCASWTYAVRTRTRPWASRIGWGHVGIYVLATHPFLVSSGPADYREKVAGLLGIDTSTALYTRVEPVVDHLHFALVVLAMLGPGLLLLDLAVWALRAERDRRRGPL
jgi:hypothetical protein